MSSDLKPGDRALVVGLRLHKLSNGLVVTILEGPFLDDYHLMGRTTPNTVCYRVSGLIYQGEREHGKIAARYLIRLPPDSEMRQRERETEKPVAA